MTDAKAEPSAIRYLLAKRTVDDRALNQRVLADLRQLLMADAARRPRVLELGAGVGSMVKRLTDWGVLERADYVLVDRDEAALTAARKQLEAWYATVTSSSGELHIDSGRNDLTVQFERGDALEFLRSTKRHRFDLVVANAVLDLMDLEPTLRGVCQVLGPGCPFWFTINFDGETILLPEDERDERITALYHQSMHAPSRTGDSRTGRKLLEAVPRVGATLLSAGSSDWVVFPQNGYQADEAYFLHHIVDTMRDALSDHPDLEAETLENWVAQRHRQIEDGRLVYIAHQLDVLGTSPA
jgi:SAM-dependent methyltransferase